MNQYLSPHVIEDPPNSGNFVHNYSAREHYGAMGLDGECFISTAAAHALIATARQQGQTQAGFDTAATATFPTGWYAQRTVQFRRDLFFMCRTPSVWPPTP